MTDEHAEHKFTDTLSAHTDMEVMALAVFAGLAVTRSLFKWVSTLHVIVHDDVEYDEARADVQAHLDIAGAVGDEPEAVALQELDAYMNEIRRRFRIRPRPPQPLDNV